MNINVPALLRNLAIAGVIAVVLVLIIGIFSGWFARPPRAEVIAGTWKVDVSQISEPTKQAMPPGADTTVPPWLEAATVAFTADSCSLRLKDKDPLTVPCTYLGIVPDRLLIQMDQGKSKQAAWPLPTTVAMVLDPSDRQHATFNAAYWSVSLKRVDE